MTGRLQRIEECISEIGNAAAFQNLCDTYLKLKEPNFISFTRIGSQIGVQNTIKGTPDTYFRRSNGQFVAVEYTIQKTGLVNKIKNDIDACLDFDKIKLQITDIHEILVLFNSRLKPEDDKIIYKYAESKNIKIQLIGFDMLALSIYYDYPFLATDILKIPMTTGQILSLDSFMDEYNSKGASLSTPLDNTFLHRQKELSEMASFLETTDLLVLVGAAGVGKTKIGLQAINLFLETHTHYYAFAISNKDTAIADDLRIHLQQDKYYILLIDDANRMNLKPILGIFREQRKGNIKVIMTVRDYALEEIRTACNDFEYQITTLEKFSDDEIKDLISSNSFNIKNSEYQNKILHLANGNARLAIMAAKLANKKQGAFLYGSVGELYDHYFQTFIKDFNLFDDKKTLKTLAIISFFVSIDLNDLLFFEKLRKHFDIDYHTFHEKIDELNKRELVQVQYGYVRVSEQVMATYFFYKAFIKDGLLNFEALLFEFFDTHPNKFSDTVVPANNVFGYSNVLKKINNSLNVYFELIKHNEKKVFIFFDKFWFYKQSAMIAYFYLIIEKLPESQNPIYDTHYETNDFVHDQNKTLSFLTRLLQHDNEYFRDALELCFEYCRKTPIALPELIRRIREKVSFRELDEWNHFTRQSVLFDLLIEGFKEKQPYYIAAFFALAKTFLLHTHEYNEGGRNTIRFQRYPLPLNDEIKAFRQKIWEVLFDSFDIYPNEVLFVIEKMINKMMDPIPAIFKFDLDYLIPFFETKLTYNNFKHIHFVYHFISRLDFTFKKEEERTYHQLKNKFQSVEYEYFKQLDWGQLNNQKSYKFKNHELFAILKEEAIRKFFVFHAGGDFTTLHQGIENLTFVYNKENQWELHKSLNIIVEENCIQNLELGFELLESILKTYPVGLQPLYKAIQQINKTSEDKVLRLWNLLDSWNHESKWNWQFAFFNNLSESFVNVFYIEKLLNMILSCQVNYTLPRYFFDKLMLFDKEIVLKITNIIIAKNQTSNYKISLWNDFFETYSVLFPEQVDLFTITYIQQIKIYNYFDYNFTALKTLVQLKPIFLIEFIKVFFNKKDASNREDLANNLNFIWDLKDYEKQMAIISAFLFPEDLFWGSSEHRLNHFFKNLKQEQQLKATNFMLKLIEQHYNDVKKMNAIFNIIRISMPDLMEKALLHFLKFNTNIEIFKTIYWIGNGGGVYRGGAIVGRIKANKWHKILEIIEKSNQKLALIPIKTYIKQQIDSENTSGDWERKRQFINPE